MFPRECVASLVLKPSEWTETLLVELLVDTTDEVLILHAPVVSLTELPKMVVMVIMDIKGYN